MATVIHLSSRRVVGQALANHMRTSLIKLRWRFFVTIRRELVNDRAWPTWVELSSTT